jgi:hypothetical protein
MDEARSPSTFSRDIRAQFTAYVVGTAGVVGIAGIDLMLQAASVPQCLGYAGGLSERKI